ncbi:poly-beta-1,6 N-acetyl-D-glucosamine export porin PgaA [Rosenbergiella epipactidis]|uniref:poly-beta-1,6 N-acetyl-D-glucosamine export porin PgaA n=1 Tax=Rosenbergiella epipactidis TaxID=1544694 RepID=UPI001F4EAD00|nr:poly-beta-1,6 N-acetyl-D-glucosamine export porin PgaA [Rosenbergiella epipactidis]
MRNLTVLTAGILPRRWPALLCSLPLLLLVDAKATSYDELILRARDGDTAELMSYFVDESQRHPLSSSQIADWLQVASWQQDNDTVLWVWQRYGTQAALPARAFAAVASAERNLHHWPKAIAYWQQALKRAPNEIDYLSALSMTEADAGQFAAASETAEQINHLGKTTDYRLTLAYLRLRERKNAEALLLLTQAKQCDPDDQRIQRQLSELYVINRLSRPALQAAHTLSLPTQRLRAIQLDSAAELVRNALIQTDDLRTRFDTADRALALYRQLSTAWQGVADAQLSLQRLRYDRLGALVAREDYRQVIEEYHRLREARAPLPDYVKPWIATALLARKQPRQALTVLSSIPVPIMRQDDDRFSTEFYALLESGQYHLAGEALAARAAHTPWKTQVWGLPLQQPNDSWLSLQSLKTDYLVDTQDLSGAQQLSQRLATSAPGNQGLAIQYARVLSARGADRQAERILKRAESLMPDDISLETEQAYVAGNLQEWQQMDLLTDDLVARSASSPVIQELEAFRSIHHSWALQVGVNRGLHSNSPVTGSRDVTTSSRLYTPPIATNFRLFSGYQFEQSHFEEGKKHASTPSVGVEWRERDYQAEIAVNHQQVSGETHTGFQLAGWHDVDDHWRITGHLARFSTQAPLRARANHVTADDAGLGLEWRQNERREYHFSLSPTHFSDGNHRIEYQLSGKERLWTAPRVVLDFTPALSGSQNSRQNVAYYSPKNDLSVIPALTLTHQISRHYARAWRQQLSLGSGIYQQHGQATGSTTQISYGHEIEWNRRLTTGLTLHWGRQPWDGQYENTLSAQLDMTLRF